MLLETSGGDSSGKIIIDINIRYLFIEDKVKYGEVKIKWCLIDDMFR